MKEFMEGVEAFIRGEIDADNPYPDDDPRHNQWMTGWAYQYLVSESVQEDAF